MTRTAIVTGASRGLGYALTAHLAADGWRVVVDARDGRALAGAWAGAPHSSRVRPIPGDITEPAHRRALVEAAGRIDALVHNASALGPSPLPGLRHYPLDALIEIYATNVFAPIALTQLALPRLQPGGVIMSVTSDAAVEAYPGWGGYGSSKAALEQATAVLAAEHPATHVYSVDPGDMRTQMQAEAFPGEDISDRPLPDTVVPALALLLTGDLPSGRYVAHDLLAVAPA